MALDFPGGASGIKNPTTNAGHVRDKGSIPGSGRSPGGGHEIPRVGTKPDLTHSFDSKPF